MNTALLYLPYLPNVFWLSHFLKHETIVIEQEENFVKSSFRNRCEIAGANGKQILTIPLAGGRDHHQLYKDVRIANNTRWQKNHWQSIRSAYGSAPYFEFYAYHFETFYERPFDSLYEFNLRILQVILHTLQISKEFQFTGLYEKSYPEATDLRQNKLLSPSETPASGFATYYQTFGERNGFIPNLSIIDVIYNLGPQAKEYLLRCTSKH